MIIKGLTEIVGKILIAKEFVRLTYTNDLMFLLLKYLKVVNLARRKK